MPLKERHFVIPLGDIATGEASPEGDLSSASWAYLYATTSGGNTNIRAEAAPEEFGVTPTWHLYGNQVQIGSSGTSLVMAIPFDGWIDFVTPQRLRIKAASGALTDVYIEGIREIG